MTLFESTFAELPADSPPRIREGHVHKGVMKYEYKTSIKATPKSLEKWVGTQAHFMWKSTIAKKKIARRAKILEFLRPKWPFGAFLSQIEEVLA